MLLCIYNNLEVKHESFISNTFFSINNNKIFKENLK